MIALESFPTKTKFGILLVYNDTKYELGLDFLKIHWANFSAIVYIAVWIHVMFDYMKKFHVMIYGE